MRFSRNDGAVQEWLEHISNTFIAFNPFSEYIPCTQVCLAGLNLTLQRYVLDFNTFWNILGKIEVFCRAVFHETLLAHLDTVFIFFFVSGISPSAWLPPKMGTVTHDYRIQFIVCQCVVTCYTTVSIFRLKEIDCLFYLRYFIWLRFNAQESKSALQRTLLWQERLKHLVLYT